MSKSIMIGRFTLETVLEMKAGGLSIAEIRDLAFAPEGAAASSPVKEAASPKAKKANTFHEQVIVAKAPDRAARKALAHALRAAGLPANGPAWDEAKADFGIR